MFTFMLAGVVGYGLFLSLKMTTFRPRIKKSIWIGFLLLVASGFFAQYVFETDFFLVDKCLDAGGRWSNESRSCEH